MQDFLDGFFATAMESGHVPGAVFVFVENGRVVLKRGYGFANLETKARVDPDTTLFEIASVSKLFTATAVMQLYEQGKLQLDEDVNTYLTTFKIPATFPKPVTLRSLMTHTAGFDERGIGMAARTAKEWRPLGEYLAERMPPRVRPVGDGASYSNHGVALEGYYRRAGFRHAVQRLRREEHLPAARHDAQHVRDHRSAAADARAGLQVRRPRLQTRAVPVQQRRFRPAAC